MYLGNWLTESTADVYVREKRNVVVEIWGQVAQKVPNLNLGPGRERREDLNHPDWADPLPPPAVEITDAGPDGRKDQTEREGEASPTLPSGSAPSTRCGTGTRGHTSEGQEGPVSHHSGLPPSCCCGGQTHGWEQVVHVLECLLGYQSPDRGVHQGGNAREAVLRSNQGTGLRLIRAAETVLVCHAFSSTVLLVWTGRNPG